MSSVLYFNIMNFMNRKCKDKITKVNKMKTGRIHITIITKIDTFQLHIAIYCKNRYISTTLIFNIVLTASYNMSSSVTLRRTLSAEEAFWLLCQPVMHRLPLSPRGIWNDVHVGRLLPARRSENHCLPYLVNMANGVTQCWIFFALWPAVWCRV